MKQAAFLVFLHLSGCVCTLPFRKTIPLAFLCLSGFLWGAAIWCLVGIVHFWFHVSWTAFSAFAGMAAAAACAAVLEYKQNRFSFSGREACLLVNTVLISCLLAVYLCLNNYAVLSYDSFQLVNVGRSIGFNNGITSINQGFLASWGIFLPLLQAASVFLGIDYLYALQPFFAATFLACFYYLTCRAVAGMTGEIRYAALVALLGTLAMFSSYFLLFESFYIHNNFICAPYFFIALAAMWMALAEDNSAWFGFSIPAMLAFGLLRTENVIYCMMFFLLFLSVRKLSYRTAAGLLVPWAGFFFIWYITIRGYIGKGSDILNANYVLIILAVLALFCSAVLGLKNRFVSAVMAKMHIIMLCCSLLLTGAFFVINPPHMYTSLQSLYGNMVANGMWQSTWVVLLVLLCLTPLLPPVPYQRIFSFGIALFFTLLLLFCVPRHPYRLGWGGSANRILTHILPVVVFFVILKFSGALKQPGTGRTPAGIAARNALVCCLLTVLSFLAFVHYTRPVDHARHATVIEAPRWSPGVPGNPHDFSVALRGKTDRLFVASKTTCPCTVVLDLHKTIRCCCIEIVEYHKTQAFEDFSLATSNDLETWTPLYDSRNAGGGRCLRLDDTTAVIHPPGGHAPFRYLRLVLNSSRGQNRLLMKKLSVYSF